MAGEEECLLEQYLIIARSVTHAQRMTRLLSDAGISAKIRRAGGVLPVKVLFVSDDGMQEVAL